MNAISPTTPTLGDLQPVAGDDERGPTTSDERDDAIGRTSSDHLGSWAVVAAALAAVSLAIYGGPVTSTYALADDYFNVQYANTPGNVFLGMTIGSGRAVSGMAQYVLFQPLDSVEYLGLIRIVGVLGLFSCAIACCFVLTRLGLSRVVAVGCGAAVLAMPSSIVVGVWATMFPVGFACAAALLSSAIAVRPPVARWRRTFGEAAVSVLLLLLALQTYQPAATAYWASVAAAVLLDPSPPRVWFRAVLRTCAVFAIAVATYVASIELTLAMGAIAPGENRSFLFDPVDKLEWFVTDVLPLSLNPLSLSARPLIAATVAGALLVGIYLRTHGEPLERVSRCVIAALCVPGSYLSNLVVVENWPAARTRLGLDITIVVLAGVALEGWARCLPNPVVRRRVILGVAGVGAMLLTTLGIIRSSHYFTLPLHVERVAGETTIAHTPIDASEPLYIVYSSPLSTTAPGIVFDEFGLPTLSVPWSVVPFVEMTLEAQGRAEPPEYVLVAPSERSAIPTDAQVLDLSGRP